MAANPMFDRIVNGAIAESSDLRGSWVGPALQENAQNTAWAGVKPPGQDGKQETNTYAALYLWSAADLALLGWKQRVDEPPAFDPAIQTLSRGDVVLIAGVPTQEYSVEDIPLADLKAARSDEVAALLDQKCSAGVVVSGVPAPVQVRSGDRANVDGWAFRASLAKTGALAWDATTAWRLADNSSYVLATPDAMIAFADAVGAGYLALWKRSCAIKDAIGALTDGAAIVAYDVTAGW